MKNNGFFFNMATALVIILFGPFTNFFEHFSPNLQPLLVLLRVDVVQSDHAPEAGVAQGIFHGHLIRRRDGHQEKLEEELEEKIERRVRRNHSRHQTQVRMHG